MSKRQMIPGIIGIVILTVILAGSVLAPVLAPYEVNAVDMSQTLRTPSTAHLFGTDLLGRDIQQNPIRRKELDSSFSDSDCAVHAGGHGGGNAGRLLRRHL